MSDVMVPGYDPDKRLGLDQLKQMHDRYRRMHGRLYVHRNSHERYQLLFTCFNEATNEVKAIYCSSAMTWLKFERPMTEFEERFIDYDEWERENG